MLGGAIYGHVPNNGTGGGGDNNNPDLNSLNAYRGIDAAISAGLDSGDWFIQMAGNPDGAVAGTLIQIP